jgi:hypothetical protein
MKNQVAISSMKMHLLREARVDKSARITKDQGSG